MVTTHTRSARALWGSVFAPLRAIKLVNGGFVWWRLWNNDPKNILFACRQRARNPDSGFRPAGGLFPKDIAILKENSKERLKPFQ